MNQSTTSIDQPPSHRPWSLRWAQLLRLPTVFTVIAQMVAAFLVAGSDAADRWQAWPRGLLVLLAGIAVYWSGMIFNDLWDYEEDRRERPERPLPSGQITLVQARRVAWGLWAASIMLALLGGILPVAGLPVTFAPAWIAAALAVCVVLYDGPLKATPLAPLTMGLCRLLCFLLGAAPWVAVGGADFLSPLTWFPPHVLLIAVGFGVYISGVTTISRMETGLSSGSRWDLQVGVLVALIGAAILATGPGVADGVAWAFRPDRNYALLIGLITLPVALRGFRVMADPQPQGIQALVRVGVLNVIAYSAALGLVAAGPFWALGIFFLAILALLLASRLRVT